MTIFQRVDRLKAAIDGVRPFEGAMLDEIRGYYRIALTWSSNAIEGNTLTESETKVLLEDGLTAGGKPLRDSFEAIGHAEAYDFMFSLLQSASIAEEDAQTMHRMFYRNIDESAAGCYRNCAVLITGSNYPVTEPGRISAEMVSLFEWANSERGGYHPVEFAARVLESEKEMLRLLHIPEPEGCYDEELISGITDENGHGEFGWGEDAGKE